MDEEYYLALKKAKKENYQFIYGNTEMKKVIDTQIAPMFFEVYEALLKQAVEGKEDSLLYRHHIDFLCEQNKYRDYFSKEEYISQDPNQIVVDYMASMTDDYLIDLYHYLFPKGKYNVTYKGYF